MPYADSNDYRKSHRESFNARYATDKAFRLDEALRKNSWYHRNREKVIARVLARREALKAAKK